MFIELQREALVGCRVCTKGDVIDVDESRGKRLVDDKIGAPHAGPATVSIEPSEPADERLPTDDKSVSTSETAPKSARKSTK